MSFNNVSIFSVAAVGRTLAPTGSVAIGDSGVCTPHPYDAAVTLTASVDGTVFGIYAQTRDTNLYSLIALPAGSPVAGLVNLALVGTAIDYPSLGTCQWLPAKGGSLDQYIYVASDGVHITPFASSTFVVPYSALILDPSPGYTSRLWAFTNPAATTIQNYAPGGGVVTDQFTMQSAGPARVFGGDTGDFGANNAVTVRSFGTTVALTAVTGITLSTASGDINLTPPATGHVKINAINFDDYLPWRIEFDPLMTPDANTNWSTFAQTGTVFHAGYLQSSGAQNAIITWNNIWLAAGTWKYEILHHQGGSNGQYQLQLGGTNAGGVIEGYNASPTNNVRTSITGITVATTSKTTVALKMATKNASSASYFGLISKLVLTRTA